MNKPNRKSNDIDLDAPGPGSHCCDAVVLISKQEIEGITGGRSVKINYENLSTYLLIH